jgi:hypothetical protein
MADDMECPNQGWLELAIHRFKSLFKDDLGLLSFNEGIQKGRIFTTGMSSKEFVHRISGNLYYPGYKHYKGDREVTEIAREMGVYHYAEDVVVNHYHFSRGYEKDSTYELSENKFLNKDRELYHKRSAINNKTNKYDY